MYSFVHGVKSMTITCN